LFDYLFLVAVDEVGEFGLFGGEVGDFLDALGVEDVVRVEHLDRGLFEIVDGGVFEHEAVEVGADDLEDFVAECVAVFIELGELEAFPDRFECLGEFRVEKLADRGLA